MKKIVFLIVLLFLTRGMGVGAAAAPNYSPDFEVSAKGVYLYNLDTDTPVYAKNADTPLPPASLTKVMTCILALENTPDLDSEMVTYPNYVQDYLYTYQRQVGSVSLGGLMAGETLPMRQLLYALMLPSANEAAMIVADHIGGSQEGFVQMMNSRAKELGAKNTNFVNPNGLYDPEHLTTAYDLFMITRHAMTLPGFMDIVTTTSYVGGPTNLHDRLEWKTTNELMVPDSSYYTPYIKGIKTGTLPESGRCFISSATKNGFSYLLVVMGSAYTDAEGNRLNGNAAFDETLKLYDWVFGTFKQQLLVNKGETVAGVALRLSSEKDQLSLMTAERFTTLAPPIDRSRVAFDPIVPQSVDAPVSLNDPVGEVRILVDGEEFGRIPLLAAETVAASPVLAALEKARAVTRSFWFKFAVIFLALVIVLYIVLMIIRNRNRRRFGRYRPRRRI